MTCLSPLTPADRGPSRRPPVVRSPSSWWCAGAEWRLVGLGVAGALLLAIPGLRYRIGANQCGRWPALGPSIGYAALYLLALLLLTVAFLGLCRRAGEPQGPSLRRMLCYGALINAAALVAPPFLSDDPLFYAATSRVLAVFGQGAYTPLCQALPKDDPFLTMLPLRWQCGTSAYFPGFQVLSWGVGKLAGSSLELHLRLYQLLAASALLLTAWVTGAALVPTRLRPALGAALVACNPLTVIEGTIGAHNDALLALGCAGFVYFVVRARQLPALLSLLTGLAIKASAALLLFMYGLYLILGAIRRRWPALTRQLPWVAAGALGLALLGIALLHFHVRGGTLFTSLVGSPADPWDYCTRSVECLPRVLLRWILHLPTAAWAVGLGFRVLGGLWLAWCAWRAGARPLSWLGSGLAIYYLYLHGWAQTWYLLSVLPFLPFAPATTRAALLVLCVSGCAYYGVFLIGGCVVDNLDQGVVDLLEGLVTVVPPSVALWRDRNRTDA
jgi:hypothetical protein